jgi:hypothetical protein
LFCFPKKADAFLVLLRLYEKKPHFNTTTPREKQLRKKNVARLFAISACSAILDGAIPLRPCLISRN